LPVFGRVIEAHARTVVAVSASVPLQERPDQRINLTGAPDVLTSVSEPNHPDLGDSERDSTIRGLLSARWESAKAGGLRYEVDTDVKNVRRASELIRWSAFLKGTEAETATTGPRVGAITRPKTADEHSRGYGIYYDRITLEIQSLERGLDGAPSIEVAPGRSSISREPFDPVMQFPPERHPGPVYRGSFLTARVAAGITSSTTPCRPHVHMNLGFNGVAHNYGCGRLLAYFGTPSSSAADWQCLYPRGRTGCDYEFGVERLTTKYDGYCWECEKRFARHYQFRASLHSSKAFNFANDDSDSSPWSAESQSEFEYDQHQTISASLHLLGYLGFAYGIHLAPIFTLASGVADGIPGTSGANRIPQLQRNAGRLFHPELS